MAPFRQDPVSRIRLLLAVGAASVAEAETTGSTIAGELLKLTREALPVGEAPRGNANGLSHEMIESVKPKWE